MESKRTKEKVTRPYVEIHSEATVYIRDESGRSVAVETLPVQWKQYDNRR